MVVLVVVRYGRQVGPPAPHACGPRGIQAVSRNRFALSSMLRLSSDRAIEHTSGRSSFQNA
jgi:hypothetical protein